MEESKKGEETLAEITLTNIDVKKRKSTKAFPWVEFVIIAFIQVLGFTLLYLSVHSIYIQKDRIKSIMLLIISLAVLSVSFLYMIKHVVLHFFPNFSKFKILEEIPEIN